MARAATTTRRLAIPPVIPMSMAMAMATADVPSRGSTSRSDIPTGTYWRQPDGYQPGEYHADSHRSDGYQADGYRSAGYQTDRYQSDSYQTDGYQTAAYPSGPADHAADAESELAGVRPGALCAALCAGPRRGIPE